HGNIKATTRAMTGLKDIRYDPIPENVAVYEELYGLYLTLHDGFGGITRDSDLSKVMKDLIEIRDRVRAA
ncbi:MAG: ribulokinase, partial [Martelella sp.]